MKWRFETGAKVSLTRWMPMLRNREYESRGASLDEGISGDEGARMIDRAQQCIQAATRETRAPQAGVMPSVAVLPAPTFATLAISPAFPG
jgi:hypothetical protein